MGISCACEYPDYDPEWYWEVHDEPSILDTKRFRKCVSCKVKLDVGESVYTVYRWHSPRNDIEERIHGDEVPMPTWYLCPSCAAIYHALAKVNACVNLGEDNLQICLQEFNAEYAPPGFTLNVKPAATTNGHFRSSQNPT